MAAVLRMEHLEKHLTDGQWHDDCKYCLARRSHGGTGVEDVKDGQDNTTSGS